MISNSIPSLRGRLGAYELHAKRSAQETTEAARAAFLATFLDRVDPRRELPEAERERRASAARSAWFTRLALESAKVRRANALERRKRAKGSGGKPDD